MPKNTEEILVILRKFPLSRGLRAAIEQAERARRDAVKAVYMATRSGPLLTRHGTRSSAKIAESLKLSFRKAAWRCEACEAAKMLKDDLRDGPL